MNRNIAPRKITLALADDFDIQRNIMSALIAKCSAFELVALAAHGRDLISKLDRLPSAPEVCILDLHMPEMDGITTATILSSKYPSIKLFGYTTEINTQSIDQFRRHGALHVFPKDKPQDMLAAIKRHVT